MLAAHGGGDQFAAGAFEEGHALVFVEHLEGGIDPGLDRIFAQEPRAKRVDGRDARKAERAPRADERRPAAGVGFACDPIVEYLGDSAAHVGSGLLGERDGGDPLGR